MRREKKCAALTIRLRPSVRAMAEKRAAEEDQSLANYISQLIVSDTKTSGNDVRKQGFSDQILRST
jgi:predicted HicB family RNase H-like nuclease